MSTDDDKKWTTHTYIDDVVFSSQTDASRSWMKKLDEVIDEEFSNQVYLRRKIRMRRRGAKSLLDFATETDCEKRIDEEEVNLQNLVGAMKTLVAFTQFFSETNSANKESKLSVPHLPEKGMIFLLPREHRDAVMGDLLEDYFENILPRLGPKLARRWYYFQAFRAVLHYNGLTARLIKLIETWKKSNGS